MTNRLFYDLRSRGRSLRTILEHSTEHVHVISGGALPSGDIRASKRGVLQKRRYTCAALMACKGPAATENARDLSRLDPFATALLG